MHLIPSADVGEVAGHRRRPAQGRGRQPPCSPDAGDLALAGTLGVVVIAVLLDLLFLVVGRLPTSKGLR